jgi:molybdenum cofactor cytidylyltransferase
MLLLGDMPGVGAVTIDAVATAWERRRPWAAVTSYRGERGHPFVFAQSAFGALRALHGDKAVWKLLEQRPVGVLEVPIERALPRDVDTWDDYEAVLRELSAA